MSNEATLWKTMQKALGAYGRLDRVENRLGGSEGMPDVAYLLRRSPIAQAAAGWVELKYEPAWPKRAATPIVFTKLTLDQVTWTTDYAALGGRVYILAQIEHSYVLLRAGMVRAVYERRLTRADMEASALVVTTGHFPALEVLRCLTS